MILDANRLEPSASIGTDVCIVGGGVAGITIALRLARAGIRSWLLEGGGERYSSRSQALYEGVAWDRRYSLTGTRTRMLGGSSNCWGGWTRPAGPVDFAPRPWLGCLGWPIAAPEVAPYEEAAAALLEVPVPEPDAALEAALEPDRARAAAIGRPALGAIFFGMSPPTAFGTAYRAQLAEEPRVTVALNATATALATDPACDRIAAIEARSERGAFRVTPAIVILAAGGIENPRLLLASGGIGNAHDLVGRYFMDHPRIRLRHMTLGEDAGLVRLCDARHYAGGSLLGQRGRVGAAFSPLPDEQRRAEVLQSYTGLVACYFGQSDSTLEDARQLYKALRGRLHEPIDARRIGRVFLGLPAASAYALGRKLDIRGKRMRFEVETVVEPLPDRENRIELTGERDRHNVPKVRLTWRRHDLERRTHRHAVDLVQRAIEAGGRGRMEIDAGVWERGRWDRAVMTTWHHMGTTRMAASAATGVVDADCRVFGTANLYIAGSSVFSTGGGSPPTFMVAALALRLADHVSGRLGGRKLATVAQAPLPENAIQI